MFAKLMQKIKDEAGEEGPSLGPGIASPVRIDSGPTSPSLPTGSGYSSSSEEPNTTTKEDILKLLMKRTEQCKKLDSNAMEYVTVIKEKNRNIEKLELSLEKQQDAMSKRLQDLNEQYQSNRVKLTDGFKEAFNKREQEFLDRIAAIEVDKLELEKKLKNKISQKDEENEEIQGFVTQETAKVKHMLLITQEELARCQQNWSEKSRLLEESVKSSSELHHQLETWKSDMATVTKDRDKFRESEVVQAELVNTLTTEKGNLEKQLEVLNNEISQKASQILKLQSSNVEFESKYVTLERNGDLNRNKTSKLLEEKSDKIDQLMERVRTLEDRLKGQTLSDDERISAIEKERDSVEAKLIETREQLTEVKSTWSDKITQLEDQVSHLNAKIVEDSEEMSQSQNTISDMKEKFSLQMEEIKKRLEDAEIRALENWELANQKDVQYDKEKMTLENIMEVQKMEKEKVECDLKQSVASLESEISSLQSSSELEKSRLLQKADELESQQQKSHERCLESEKRVRRLEDECTQLKERVIHKEGECNSSNEELERKQGEITTLQNRVSEIEKEKGEMEKKIRKTQETANQHQQELSTSNHDKDELMLRNAELSQQIEKLRVASMEEKRELQSEVEQKSDAVISLQNSLAIMEEKVTNLEQKIKSREDEQNQTTVNISELESLEQTVACLEDQVNEKNKTIKVQQQRLTDLKKTLQRELKVQALPNDMPFDAKELSASPPVARRNNTKNSRPTVTGSTTSPALLPFSQNQSINSLQSLQHLDDEHSNSFRESLQDDVNFEYLKHVVLKFMLSREPEALQLIKAVSVLLRFSVDEQKLIRETLEWKMSWFGARPPLGSGQKAKIIPPQY